MFELRILYWEKGTSQNRNNLTRFANSSSKSSFSWPIVFNFFVYETRSMKIFQFKFTKKRRIISYHRVYFFVFLFDQVLKLFARFVFLSEALERFLETPNRNGNLLKAKMDIFNKYLLLFLIFVDSILELWLLLGQRLLDLLYFIFLEKKVKNANDF